MGALTVSDADALEAKELLKGAVQDMVPDLLYYDRRHDDELSDEDVSDLFVGGHVTTIEIARWFRDALIAHFDKDNYP